MTTLDDALDYYQRGWCIIPIRPGTKKPACRSWKGYQTERPDVATIRRWFGSGGPKSLAVVLGEVSGNLVCRDFDQMPSYERWAAEYPELAGALPTVETGRGRHVYATADIGRIRAASPSGGSIIELGDGELRGGGYCLVPRSKHPNGKTYNWIIPLNGQLPIVDLDSSGFLPCNREARENGGLPRDQRTLVGVEVELKTLAPHCPLGSLDSQDSLLHSQVEQAIAETQPSGTRQRHRLLFELARELKAIPALADAPVAELKPYARQWHQRALPHITTKPFEESWFDFAEAWDKVKFPKGTEPIAMILTQAVKAGLPEVAEQYEQEELRLLVSLCRELQRACGDGAFFLATRTAGQLLGVNHVTASRWLRLLILDGILELVTAGTRESRRASRYRYVAG